MTRLASIQTLGFLCEDLEPEDISADLLNSILGSVLQNIIPDQKELSLIAIRAFARAAPVTNRNFQVKEQRDFIMNAIFQATQIDDEEALKYLMQSLCDIARVNYDYLEEYILPIGEMTVKYINSDMKEVALQAIEFWTSLCEVELERNLKQIPHNNIVTRCSASLIEIVKLGYSKEDPDSDS